MSRRSQTFVALCAVSFVLGCGSDAGSGKKGPTGSDCATGQTCADGGSPDASPPGSNTNAGDPGHNGGDGGGPVPGKGVGMPCETDKDCMDGLGCHSDTDTYISNRQCTASCASNEACTRPFGKDTMCLGAEVCALLCTTDEDCPTGTTCGDNLWCERKGPGSGNPYCTGTATPCSLLTGTSCVTALGCRDDSSCGGVSSSCYSQYSSYACNTLDGCYWSSSSGSGHCTGVSSSCSSQPGPASCGGQDGCHWDDSCTGVAQDCSMIPVASCETQPGCTLGH